MSYIIVDVESDGPCPGLYSMVSFGAILVTPDLATAPTFYGQCRPISEQWVPEALAVSGHTREETMAFQDAVVVMPDFRDWIIKHGGKRPMFVSDNNGFDWQFVNYYFHMTIGKNPFGFSSTNLGSLYKGLARDTTKNFKHLRKTKHSHHPVDDARGNAEALVAMREQGLKFPWE